MGYYFQGNYVDALNYWRQALTAYETINDEIGISNMLNNIAAIYSEQGDEDKGLEFSLRSLKLAEKTGDKLRILSALNTVASIYYNKKSTWDKALNYLLQGLPLCEEIGDNEALGIFAENIGEIYFYKGDATQAVSYFEKSIKASPNAPNSAFAYNGLGKVYLKKGELQKALGYHNTALELSTRLNSKANIIQSLDGIANVYLKQDDYPNALNYFHQARTVAEEVKASPDLKEIYLELSDVYSRKADFKNAFKYKTLYADIKDTLYNIETAKKLNTLQFDFDMEKKQGEINLLTKDKALTDLKLKRQQLAKNAFMIGLGLVMLIALLIFRSYRVKVKTHKILDRQKNEIETLLLNILPREVAHELQTSGHATPRHYESVSVMFTDFKGFTIIADNMSPDELVAELDACFIAFDAIIENNKLEKIKTIGDSYMCAGGIPTTDEMHAFRIIKAGLEIQEYVTGYNARRKNKGLAPWDVRIGIHVGPVVAGVVGKKKYAYDIWGSTVNIASRMESNGEPGQVNISSHTYELIKDKFDCTYRGKIFAKNIGDIDMYFVSGEKNNGQEISVSTADENVVPVH
jgi:class 3 adenylate cyclase/tetratricopeptide (TPR) repeat protein